MSFTEFSHISPIPKENKRVLEQDLVRGLRRKGDQRRIIVPKGFVFDGASVPRVLWSFIPPTEANTITSSCIHDRLYHIKGKVGDYYLHNNIDAYMYNMTRKDCDEVFAMSLIANGVSPYKTAIMYAGVRLGGRYYWRQKPKHFLYLPN